MQYIAKQIEYRLDIAIILRVSVSILCCSYSNKHTVVIIITSKDDISWQTAFESLYCQNRSKSYEN